MQTAVSENMTPGSLPPSTMRAAVYQGNSAVVVESVPTPPVGPGELLVRVESCGICHTDLKKIEYNLLPGPRIYGHETAGTVVALGSGVTRFQPGDRVIAFHHIPCGDCFYCYKKLYAQCPVYKRVGITAGFEPAGGGFAQYIRIMDWIVRDGVEKIPDGVSADEACFVEPVNTCLKAVVQADPCCGDVALVMGQGPIGLLFTMLIARTGATVITTDTIQRRRDLAVKFGAASAWNPRDTDIAAEVQALTNGRGADMVFVATSAPGLVEQAIRCSRPGSKILLFSQTSDKERIEISGADICMGERTIFGSYSASLDLQKESANLVFSGTLPVKDLISHRVSLNEIEAGFQLALHPGEGSLKIIVHPQRWL